MSNIPSIRIVLQARTSSTRLPAKVLLPLLPDLPVFVAACRRAANTGRDILLASSSDESDNLLADMAAYYEIPCLRGPLDNVLERFALATRDMQDDDICVRLTCDNVLPDGHLVDRLVAECLEGGYQYYAAGGRVPYGFSVEVFSVFALRQAQLHANSLEEHEHVTPWIRSQLKNGCAQLTGIDEDFSAWRCTIDTLQDYLRMADFFRKNPSRINKNAFELMHEFISETSP